MSHEIVNKLIILMRHKVLRQLLDKVKANSPAWYAIIVDETTDIATSEQFNLSIRYVYENYAIYEDHIGMFNLVRLYLLFLKDMVTHCALSLSLCCGQAYDAAAEMPWQL